MPASTPVSPAHAPVKRRPLLASSLHKALDDAQRTEPASELRRLVTIDAAAA